MSAWGTKWIVPDKPVVTSEGKTLPDKSMQAIDDDGWPNQIAKSNDWLTHN